MITFTEIENAAAAISPYLLRTPTIASPGLSELIGVPTTIKIESLQRTGSFKARGATAKLLALSEQERAAGVVAVSGGNHGIAVATMAQLLGVRATVVMPRTASRDSIERSRATGASVQLTEGMPRAFELVEELQAEGATLLHPFDDPVVIAGQGTVGLELAADAAELTDVLVSVGGGGLIAGIATAVRAQLPNARIWGVEPTGARAMTDALAAGGPVTTDLDSVITTLSAPQVSDLTYRHVAALVEEIVLVSDADAVAGTVQAAERAGVWVEPADGSLLPAARVVADRVGPNAHLALVLAGANASLADVTAWSASLT
ncbi:pyridoxal-phosphate dependent enzyme [Microlunatus soli]|uniref:L-threonine ammonia-lyase n=1 Tax=Microlunatus soli TaxID=630515 RepID=A0A1H1N0N1_9ACTN|nr:pyridoxal-phosphate dependent enzyme [Microlunatus soli]SDR92255.1 L-threonine ammonia-lyase [Microlunatus soli]